MPNNALPQLTATRGRDSNGLLLLLLKSHVPLAVLFSNGERILDLVSMYLASCAARLRDHLELASHSVVVVEEEEEEEERERQELGHFSSSSLSGILSTTTTAAAAGGGSGSTGRGKGRPLVEVISSQDHHPGDDAPVAEPASVSPLFGELKSEKEEEEEEDKDAGEECREMYEACSTCLAIGDAVVTIGSNEGKVRSSRPGLVVAYYLFSIAYHRIF